VEKVDSEGAVEREERGRLAELIVSCWAVVFGFVVWIGLVLMMLVCFEG
jgi:hypothetical protein